MLFRFKRFLYVLGWKLTPENQAKMIAEKIYSIEHAHFKEKRKWKQENVSSWDINDEIYLTISDDCMVWYVWKSNFTGDKWFKVVQRGYLDRKTLYKIIKVQPWEYL